MAEEQGFAKLLGTNFAYILNEKSLFLGRKQKQPKAGYFEMGASKNISRQHAELKWDSTECKWVLVCMGKNGFEVNEKHYSPTSDPVVLAHRDKVDIGEVTFFFLLPNVNVKDI